MTVVICRHIDYPDICTINKIKMETTINALINHNVAQRATNNTWNELLAKVDGEAEHKTVWYLFSLIFQGVVFLPIPAVLMYYYHAPIVVLPITFGLYLGNIIVGMGGSGIRVVLGFQLFTALVNLSMLMFFVL
jgi:hypothetical protein